MPQTVYSHIPGSCGGAHRDHLTGTWDECMDYMRDRREAGDRTNYYLKTAYTADMGPRPSVVERFICDLSEAGMAW